MKTFRFLIGLAFLAAAVTPALADPIEVYTFTAITNNSGQSADVAGQFSVSVSDLGGGRVAFEFKNAGPIASVVTQVYWDDSTGVLSAFFSLPSDWGAPATPHNLPAGTPVGFAAEFSAGADPSPIVNGIDVGESATFVFDLAAGATAADVIDALENGDAHVGLHAQSIGTRGLSDSFVNGSTSQSVPEPSSLALWVCGLLGVGLLAKYRIQS